MGNLANSEDPDEMLQSAAFHQDLHRLLSKNLKGLKYNIFRKLKPNAKDHPFIIIKFNRSEWLYIFAIFKRPKSDEPPQLL